MKKKECIHSEYHTGEACLYCGHNHVKQNGITVRPDSYAAEFLLYAFHFESQVENENTNTMRANAFRMLVTEG